MCENTHAVVMVVDSGIITVITKGKEMAIRFKTWVLVLVCFSISLPAMVMAEDYFHTPYNSHISIERGQSKTPGTCSTTWVDGAYCHEGGINYRIGYGYHFSPMWGMELSYGDFGSAVEQGVFPSGGLPAAAPAIAVGPAPYTWTWQAGGWELAGTATLHFGDSFSLIGKLGVIRANTQSETVLYDASNTRYGYSSDETSTNVSTGIAVQYDFNRDYAARILYGYYGKVGHLSKINSSVVSGCLVLKF